MESISMKKIQTLFWNVLQLAPKMSIRLAFKVLLSFLDWCVLWRVCFTKNALKDLHNVSLACDGGKNTGKSFLSQPLHQPWARSYQCPTGYILGDPATCHEGRKSSWWLHVAFLGQQNWSISTIKPILSDQTVTVAGDIIFVGGEHHAVIIACEDLPEAPHFIFGFCPIWLENRYFTHFHTDIWHLPSAAVATGVSDSEISWHLPQRSEWEARSHPVRNVPQGFNKSITVKKKSFQAEIRSWVAWNKVSTWKIPHFLLSASKPMSSSSLGPTSFTKPQYLASSSPPKTRYNLHFRRLEHSWNGSYL